VTQAVRIAFPPIGGSIWTGGQNWLGNLVRTVKACGIDTVEPVMMVDADYAPAMIADLEARGVEVVRDEGFGQQARRSQLFRTLATGCDRFALDAYRRHGIDVVFESADYHGWRFPLPTLSWFPDFQHRHLPHMFGKAAWWRREIGFRLTLARHSHILLSSQDAARDLRTFYPGNRTQVHVVPFAVPAPARLTRDAIEERRVAAGIPPRWFFLPNHFWQHKNHRLAVAATAEAVRACPDLTVVCTGNSHDPRNPAAFAALEADIARLDLTDNFRILGLVPYSRVEALLQGAVSMVNPSLFEGWSTPVEEAKAIGKPMILSDLPVHIEQVGDGARYFDRSSSTDLARAMVEVWTAEPPLAGPDVDNTADLKRFANRFAAAAQAAAQ
jgi:glycosyltransferase involved in cell wall biosynthesis